MWYYYSFKRKYKQVSLKLRTPFNFEMYTRARYARCNLFSQTTFEIIWFYIFQRRYFQTNTMLSYPLYLSGYVWFYIFKRNSIQTNLELESSMVFDNILSGLFSQSKLQFVWFYICKWTKGFLLQWLPILFSTSVILY